MPPTTPQKPLSPAELAKLQHALVNDPDTLELFRQHGVPLPVKEAPPPPPPVVQQAAPQVVSNGANGAGQKRPPTVPPGTLQTPVLQAQGQGQAAQAQAPVQNQRRP